MAIKVFWDNFNHTAVRFEFSGSWSWKAFRTPLRQAVAMIRSVDHRVDVIFNTVNSKYTPDNMVGHFASIMPFLPENCGSIMFVGQESSVCDVFTSLHKPYRRAGFDLLLVGNMDQARKGLAIRRRYAAAS